MKRKDFNGKKIIFILSFFIFTGTLFALDMPKVDQNAIFALLQKKDVDIQSLYDDMSDLIPAIVYLQPNYTSGIDLELVKKVDFEIKNQMITSMTFKPVTMNKWLDSNYGTKKALSIYQLINDLKKERYSVNLTGLCKSYIYRIGKSIAIKISIYPFSRNGYPISAIRIIKSERDMKTAIKYILDDLSTLMKTELESKIRLAVEPFSVNCRTLIEQKTGEFDFISTSFSNQEGVEIKNTDDYFSELFSYQAQCTGLFDATNTQNIDEYIDAVKRKSTYYSGNSDYLIKGNIVLSNKLNLITIQLINTNTGKVVRTMRHITKFLSLQEIWNFNYKFISDICLALYKKDEVKVLNEINNENRCFYINGMFAGFDRIHNFPVKSGKTIINTGNNFFKDVSINHHKKNKDYYIYTNNDEILIYNGREGEYVWNLLEK